MARSRSKSDRPVRTKPWTTGPFHHSAEVRAVAKVLAGPAQPLARGPENMKLRENLCELYGVRYALPLSSGSAAIHVALAALGIGPGDEVIISPLTDYGSVAGILQLNATVVFADVVPGNLVMDVRSFEQRITPRTRAVMPIHIAGYPVDMGPLMQIARSHNLAVIEDCAQSHLLEYRGKYAGVFGDAGCFSLNESKHAKCGEGGFILTNARELYAAAELFSDKCYPRFPKAPKTPAIPAINVRMSDLNAAVANVQLKGLPKWIAQRRKLGQWLDAAAAEIPGVDPYTMPRGANGSYWWWGFTIDRMRLRGEANDFAQAMRREGIPCTPGPQRYLPDWELFGKLNVNPNAFRTYRPVGLKRGAYRADACPVARSSPTWALAVPISQHNTMADAHDVRSALHKVAKAMRR